MTGKYTKAKSDRTGVTTTFNILLFMVFILCTLFTVLIGAKVYENIHTRNENNYSDYVILQYVANKVRGADRAGSISVRDMDGTPVLNMEQDAEGTAYVTRIYAYEGKLRELFMKSDADLKLEDGLEIADCAGLSMSVEGDLLHLEIAGPDPEKLTIDLKCADREGGS